MDQASSAPEQRRVSPGHRTARSSVGVLFVLPATWVVVDVLLASDRGVDLTDESLYLLDADPPRPYDAFGFPYGWMTGPLFRAVDGDIARFRTLGGVLLVLATGLLAHHALRFADARTGIASSTGTRLSHALVVGSIGTTGLLYYVGLPLLRTPSYNWLNLVGILVSLSGVFLACRSGKRIPAASLIAVGMFLAMHAKPTTPFLLAAASMPLLARTLGARATLRLVGATIGIGGALATVAWFSPLWPMDPLTPFLRGVRIPPSAGGHDPLNAARLLALSPLELARGVFLEQPHWLVGPLLIALLGRLASRPPIVRWLAVRPLRLASAVMALIGAIGVISPGSVVEWVHGGGLGLLGDLLMPGRRTWPVDGYLVQWGALVRFGGWLAMSPAAVTLLRIFTARAERVAALLLTALGLVSMGLLRPLGISGAGLTVGLIELGCAWLLIEWEGPRSSAKGTDAGEGQTRDRWWAVCLLAAGVGAYAFGHDTGPVNAMPAASMLAAIAVALLIVTAPSGRVRVSSDRAIVIGATFLAAATVVGIVNAWSEPYRSAPIRAQTAAIAFGPNGAVLRLEPALADYLGDLTAAAEAAGWQPGRRLYGLTATWSTGLTYALSAEAPPSLQQFLGTGPEGLDRLAFTLSDDDLAGWGDAWLLLPDFTLGSDDGIETAELEAVRRGVSLFGSRVGRSWPADYELVWTAPEDAPLSPTTRVTLWRPYRKP